MKLYVNHIADTNSFPARIVAHATKQEVKVCAADGEIKKQNATGVFPYLVTDGGSIADGVAIAKFLAHGSPLLGCNMEQRAKIDQWIYWAMSDRNMPKACAIIHGQTEVTKEEFAKINTEVKNSAKTLNGFLKDRQYLVHDHITLADIFVACHYIVAQQTLLDAGYRKAMGNYAAWFERVVASADFKAVCGNIKSCTKTIQPQFKVEAKKEEPKKQQQAAPKKPADGGDDDAPAKKAKSALELLPPTNFDLFNFKTFFVNEPDRRGAGIDELKKQFDKEGWSVWFLHYEMFGDEGKKLYHTENLADGFLQRFDDFRKWSFARMCILGTEEKQEIMGVFMWRSVGIPKECHDHPQFEYYKNRQMDIFGNPEDDKLIRDFWGSKEGDMIMGMEALTCKWHK